MPALYLTPSVVGFLTASIVAAAISLYLAGLLRRTTRPVQTAWLLGFFASVALLVLCFAVWLAASPYQVYWYYSLYLLWIALTLLFVFLVQFAYHFPEPDLHKRREARFVLIAGLVYLLWRVVHALYHLGLTAQGEHIATPVDTVYVAAIGGVWAVFVLLRQSVYASRQDLANSRNGSGLRYLLHPRGLDARAARNLALVLLSLLSFGIARLLESYGLVPTQLTNLYYSIGAVPLLLGIALVYLDYLPEAISFVVKLVGTMLASALMVLATVGWVMAPAYAATFRPALPDRQTLRFAPNALGGYDITRVPFQWDSEKGTRLNLVRPAGTLDGWAQSIAAVDFAFPFYGRTYSPVYVESHGAIGLGQDVQITDIGIGYGRKPAIFPLYLDFDTELTNGGVFTRQSADRLVITWDHVPSHFHPEAVFTFQVTLYASGVFEISYDNLPANVGFLAEGLEGDSLWLIGAVRGNPNLAPQSVDFAQLPLQTGRQGFVQDFYLTFRSYLHQALLPLVLLILASTLLIVLAMPLFIRYALVRPLNALLVGVQQVDAGRLDVEMPIRHNDEIGSLTRSFNRMVTELNHWIKRLEERTAQVLQAEAAARRHAEMLHVIAEVGRLATAGGDLQTTLETLARKITQVTGYDGAGIGLYDAEKQELTFRAYVLTPSLAPIGAKRVRMITRVSDSPALQEMLRNKQPIIFDDPKNDLRIRGAVQQLACEGDVKFSASYPLLFGEEFIGRLDLWSIPSRTLSPEDINLLSALANGTAAVVQNARLLDTLEQRVAERTRELEATNALLRQEMIERERLFIEVQQLAITDSLTGVYNRRYFLELADQELDRSRRYGHPVSVILFDLDHFKRLNDVYGHAVGDQALHQAIELCRCHLRHTDIVGRYGGEEFAVLLPETTLRDALQIAERIRIHIAQGALTARDGVIHITVSLGVAGLHSQDSTFQSLLERADQAMYASKEHGRNRVTSWEQVE